MAEEGKGGAGWGCVAADWVLIGSDGFWWGLTDKDFERSTVNPHKNSQELTRTHQNPQKLIDPMIVLATLSMICKSSRGAGALHPLQNNLSPYFPELAFLVSAFFYYLCGMNML